MSDNKPNNRKPRRSRRKDADAQPALDPARAARFVWQAEDEVIITKARWGRSYSPALGHTILVQDLQELKLHLEQSRSGVPFAEALAEVLAAPDFPFAPASLKRELREAGYAVPGAEEDAP